MPYALDDTIAAIATAPGGGARGVIRISGPDALRLLDQCLVSDEGEPIASQIERSACLNGAIRVEGRNDQPAMIVPGNAFVWPTARSYTRQPSVEFHTLGSPPLVAAVLDQFQQAGARPAAPGEFTLRAFLAGRLDLTQAEGVLGVVDARDRSDLDAALDQIAGGLSRPLAALRGKLLDTLAELEAGLDFVEEDIEFISRESLRTRLIAAQAVVANTLAQLIMRDHMGDAPRVVILGPPNAGKSSLFNALLSKYGRAAASTAIVSPQPGATRDYLSAPVEIYGVACELVDTAGEDPTAGDSLHQAAQQTTAQHRRRADVRLHCVEWTSQESPYCDDMRIDRGDIRVVTKQDLAGPQTARHIVNSKHNNGASSATIVACSSLTGAGLNELARLITDRIAALDHESRGGASAITAARCTGSLQHAAESISAATELLDAGGDELIAAEIRAALDGLGEVVGAVCADDVLDRIFSQFCIGK